jgi:hypothetical protein
MKKIKKTTRSPSTAILPSSDLNPGLPEYNVNPPGIEQ